jgi:hypothetical protein
MISPSLKNFRIAVAVSSLLVGLAVLLLLSQTGWAQTGSGSVSGTVRDAKQAVIPGVEVTITNEETNIARVITTNEVGAYKIGALPIGHYKMVVELTGFKRWVGTFERVVGQDAGINPTLEVGELSTTVEVSGAALAINTVGMDLSNVKDAERIRDLPLNGRSISNLFDLTAGVEGGANARVNGLKIGSLDITLDGSSVVDRFGGGMVVVQPGLDIIQEFRIETTGSDARYSRPATVTLATRSGTNSFHGSLFETHRNNTAGLVARRRENPVGFAPPHYIRNEFGASAGGPVWLGKLYDGHDKTFWFFAYEGARQREPYYPYYSYTPTAAMWGGDLSNLTDADGNKYQLYDPLTTDSKGNRQPFVGNKIPASRISQIAKTLQAMTDLPTDSSNPYVSYNNYHRVSPRKTDLTNYTTKIDHKISSKDNLSVRWTNSRRVATVEGGYYGNPLTPDNGYGTSARDTNVNNVSANWARTITPTLLNQLNVNVHRSFNHSGTLADPNNWDSKLGTPNPFGETGWPTMYAGNFAFDADNRKNQALTGVVFEDNVSWNKGRHEIQFGARLRRELNNVRELQQAQGNHNFGGEWTALWSVADGSQASFTGDGFADLLLGLPDSMEAKYNRGYFYFQQWETGLYATDRWRITPRLTVTLGLRWDKWTPYNEKYNRMVNVDLNTIGTKFEVVTPGNTAMASLPGVPPAVLSGWSARGLTYTTADAIGYPGNLFRAANHNFGPRLGFAYQLNSKTVLRGGYGEYFWPMPLSQLLQSTRTTPPLNAVFGIYPNEKNSTYNYTLVSVPTSTDYIANASIPTTGAGGIPSGAVGVYFWDGRTWEDSRAQSWHVTAERELMRNTVLRLSYLGGHGSQLEQRFAANSAEAQYNYVARTGLIPSSNSALLRANPNWAPQGINHTGYSNTNSAQVELERRFSRGISFQWFYTYSRSLTTTDAGGSTSGDTAINSAGGATLVPENIQLIGNPTLSYDQRLALTYYNSSAVPAHHIRYNGNVELPFGRGKQYGSGWNPWINGVLGGWQVAVNGDWRSGNWLSPSTGLYAFGDPRLSADQRVEVTYQGKRQRLWFKGYFDPTQASNVTGGDLLTLVPVDRSQRVLRPVGAAYDNRVAQTLKTGAIRQTALGDTYNFSPRGNIMGPGARNTDIGIYKNFRIKEAATIRIKGDFFNAFNHPNDVNPNMSTGLQDLSVQANDGRIIQLSLRVDW